LRTLICLKLLPGVPNRSRHDLSAVVKFEAQIGKNDKPENLGRDRTGGRTITIGTGSEKLTKSTLMGGVRSVADGGGSAVASIVDSQHFPTGAPCFCPQVR
jgi:hypothetical protein